MMLCLLQYQSITSVIYPPHPLPNISSAHYISAVSHPQIHSLGWGFPWRDHNNIQGNMKSNKYRQSWNAGPIHMPYGAVITRSIFFQIPNRVSYGVSFVSSSSD